MRTALVIGTLVLHVATPVTPASGAIATTTQRVSVSSSGEQGNGPSSSNAISADGRFVAFDSEASNLVPGDTNDVSDIFIHDRQTGRTTRVSVSSTGRSANDGSYEARLSADGRFVAFTSRATNLVRGDTNRGEDVFLHDRATGETTRVSVSWRGDQANFDSSTPAISADGRYVAFQSFANNLNRAGDTNERSDVFVRDRVADTTQRVSMTWDGKQANGFVQTIGLDISADGRFVAFTSDASNLNKAGDTNQSMDVFVRDRVAHTTRRVSVTWNEKQARGGGSFSPAISADGRFVSFTSSATNINRAGDANDASDVFVRDRSARTTVRVSVTFEEDEANAASLSHDISSGGRFIVFDSFSSNLIKRRDTNRREDVFIRDRRVGTTIRVSVSSTGHQANRDSFVPVISTNGRFIAFSSRATNLVRNDTNAATDVFIRGPRL